MDGDSSDQGLQYDRSIIPCTGKIMGQMMESNMHGGRGWHRGMMKICHQVMHMLDWRHTVSFRRIPDSFLIFFNCLTSAPLATASLKQAIRPSGLGQDLAMRCSFVSNPMRLRRAALASVAAKALSRI